MDTILVEWVGLLLRWLHLVAGIAWIGSSFYFMHVDASLKPVPGRPAEEGGETWEFHGGGFYQTRKYLIAPETLASELIWHKWQSYATWLSGFFLLALVYYVGSDIYLIDPAVRELSSWLAISIGVGGLALGWLFYDRLCKSPLGADDVALAGVGFAFVVLAAYGFQSVFSGRGALIHTGALMATMMTGNVFFVIIPNQKMIEKALVAGLVPDPLLGRQAKQRSSHNNYLTLPVLFLMLSSHYPLTYSTPYAFVIVALALIAGAVIRHFYNVRHAGRGNLWWTWIVAAISMVIAIAISVTSSPAGREFWALAPPEPERVAVAHPVRATAPEDVVDIVIGRCSMCHGSEPVWDGIAIAPKGVLLDTPERIARFARPIMLNAVLTHAMPPNNLTEITDEERAVLGAWIAGSGAAKNSERREPLVPGSRPPDTRIDPKE